MAISHVHCSLLCLSLFAPVHCSQCNDGVGCTKSDTSAASASDSLLQREFHRSPHALILEESQQEAKVDDKEKNQETSWFTTTHGNLQIEADNITFYISKCNAGTDSKKKSMEDTRIQHSTCRSEQMAINASNVTQSCIDEKKAACNNMQSVFEESFCGYAESKEAFCKEFENCHVAADSAFATAKAAVEQKVMDLHDVYTRHERVNCIMSSWPLTVASRNNCNTKTIGTSHLGVTYPVKPGPNPCLHPVAPVPGDSEWALAEYLSKPWKALVEPVKDCTTTTTTSEQLQVMMTESIQSAGNNIICALFKSDDTVHCYPPNPQQILPTTVTAITDVESWQLGAWGAICFIKKSTHEVACKNDNPVHSASRWHPPANLGPAKEIKTGSDAACVRHMDDTVTCFGRGTVRPPPNLGKVTYLVLNGQTGCAIRKADDKVVCWGDMRIACPQLTNVKEIALTAHTCCMLMKNESVVCKSSDNSVYHQDVPNGLHAKQLVGAYYKSYYALQSDGTVVTFGVGCPNNCRGKIPADLGKVLWFYRSSMEEGRVLCAKTENGNRCWRIDHPNKPNYITDQINGVAVNELDV